MDNGSRSDFDCAVCLQKCHYPTKLLCGHIFCFLCVKGIAIRSKKCAMCRATIPVDYFKNPVILENIEDCEESSEEPERFQWYYEGRNGWWKYDEQSNEELEEKYTAGDNQCSLLVAGSVYDIDFTTMLQMQHNNRSRRRRIRRDTPLLPAKGIAGIKKLDNRVEEPKNDEADHAHNVNENEEVIVLEDNESEVDTLVNSLSVIDLDEDSLGTQSELENT